MILPIEYNSHYEFFTKEHSSGTPSCGFNWNARDNGNQLIVSVHYGGGTDRSNVETATFKLGDTKEQNIESVNPYIGVAGNLKVNWLEGNKHYYVTFKGSMTYGGHVRATTNEIIVTSSMPAQT